MIHNITNEQRSDRYFTAWLENLCADILFVEVNAADTNLMGKKYGKEYAP